MIVSAKATEYILVKANTNSEWDYCEFAIVPLSEQWKKEQTKRIELVTPLKGDFYFQSMAFYDTAVVFYMTAEDQQPNIEEMLGDKEWVFVELEIRELETFTVLESHLDCYRLVLYSDGTAYYTAYGKYTGEEFWTEQFSLHQLIK